MTISHTLDNPLAADEIVQRDGQISAGGFRVRQVWAPNAAGDDVVKVWQAPLGGLVDGNPFEPGDIVNENEDDGWWALDGPNTPIGFNVDANDNLDAENNSVPPFVPGAVSIARRIRIRAPDGLREGDEYDFEFTGGTPIGLTGYGGDVLIELDYTSPGGGIVDLITDTISAVTWAAGTPFTYRRTIPTIDAGSDRMLLTVSHLAPAWSGGFPYPANRRGRLVLNGFSVTLVDP